MAARSIEPQDEKSESDVSREKGRRCRMGVGEEREDEQDTHLSV